MAKKSAKWTISEKKGGRNRDGRYDFGSVRCLKKMGCLTLVATGDESCIYTPEPIFEWRYGWYVGVDVNVPGYGVQSMFVGMGHHCDSIEDAMKLADEAAVAFVGPLAEAFGFTHPTEVTGGKEV